jgi:hypothetical protein
LFEEPEDVAMLDAVQPQLLQLVTLVVQQRLASLRKISYLVFGMSFEM